MHDFVSYIQAHLHELIQPTFTVLCCHLPRASLCAGDTPMNKKFKLLSQRTESLGKEIDI